MKVESDMKVNLSCDINNEIWLWGDSFTASPHPECISDSKCVKMLTFPHDVLYFYWTWHTNGDEGIYETEVKWCKILFVVFKSEAKESSVVHPPSDIKNIVIRQLVTWGCRRDLCLVVGNFLPVVSVHTNRTETDTEMTLLAYCNPQNCLFKLLKL